MPELGTAQLKDNLASATPVAMTTASPPIDPTDLLSAACMAEFSEASAYRSLAEAATTRLGMQIDAAEIGGAVALRTEHPGLGPLVNRVIGLGLREPITEHVVALLKTRYAKLGGAWGVELSSPVATPETVAMLRSIPLRRGLPTAVLAIDCNRFERRPSIFRVVRYEGQPSSHSASIEATVFGVSDALKALLETASVQTNFRQWLAFEGSKPVGACLTFVGHSCAWFGWSATLAEYRGRGVQHTLVSHCVSDARAAGCRWMTAETAIGSQLLADPSHRNLLRAGFIELYRRHNHLFLPRPAAALASVRPRA